MDHQEKTPKELSKADKLNHAGAMFYQQGQLKPAYMHFLAALISEPNNPMVWMNIGATLAHGGHNRAAEIAGRKGQALDPFNPMFKNNIGNALMTQRKYAEATECFEQVLSSIKDDAGVYHNAGLSLYMVEDFKQAELHYVEALRLRPELTSVKNDLALALLAQGKIQQGMEEYEVRWIELFKSKIWTLDVPQWQGEDLADKRLLIHHEQGFGDSLMLSRFINNIVEADEAEVTIAVPADLVELFLYNWPNLKVIDWESDLKASDYDYHCPMMSLMKHLGISSKDEISAEPYLKAYHAPTNFFGLPESKVKIGVCWASGDHGPRLSRRRRYVPLENLLDMALLPDTTLVSLQVGEAEKDIEYTGSHSLIYNPRHRIENFYDTAKLINELDLVVTVDSAVAHLAGAMGKPVIMLSPSPRCWRWWNIKYNGLPWYEDVTIVQQASDGSWTEAIADALAEATDFVRFNHA